MDYFVLTISIIFSIGIVIFSIFTIKDTCNKKKRKIKEVNKYKEIVHGR